MVLSVSGSSPFKDLEWRDSSDVGQQDRMLKYFGEKRSVKFNSGVSKPWCMAPRAKIVFYSFKGLSKN